MSLFDEKKCETIVARLNQLTPGSKAAWGKFSVGEMLCHCADGIKMATGERAVTDKSTFLFRNLVKPLAIYLLPMPKGAPTVDEINPAIGGTKPSEFAADRRELLDAIAVFRALPENHSWAKHGSFGELTRQQWGLLHHKHIDHHLRQFGV